MIFGEGLKNFEKAFFDADASLDTLDKELRLIYHGTNVPWYTMTGNRRAASCLRPASRISTGGSSRAGGFKDQSSPPWHAALLDFQLALGAVHGFAVGNRVMQGELRCGLRRT